MARPPSRLRDMVSLSRQGQIPAAENDDDDLSGSRTPAPSSSQRNLTTPMPSTTMLDSIMEQVDATVVAGWLKHTKDMLKDLRKIWRDSDNAYRLICFLLDMRKEDFCGLVEVETGLLRDELCLALVSALTDGKLTETDLYVLMRAVLREHPRRFTQPVLVGMLTLVCLGESQCKNRYRRLLSNIRCETNVKEHIQWLLGTRAFAVASVCHGVTRLFLRANSSTFPPGDGEENFEQSLSAVGALFAAISDGRTDVVDIFLREKLIDSLQVQDEQGRTPLLAAATSGQDEMLNYILGQLKDHVKQCIDLAGQSGNTPLQAAASNGSLSAVQKLLAAGADPNCWNSQCNGATALHMAVMRGDTEIVRLLLQAGAKITAKMGLPATITPIQLSQDLGQTEIEALLSEHSKNLPETQSAES